MNDTNLFESNCVTLPNNIMGQPDFILESKKECREIKQGDFIFCKYIFNNRELKQSDIGVAVLDGSTNLYEISRLTNDEMDKIDFIAKVTGVYRDI